MKLQQNKNGVHFVYIPATAVKELGLEKRDEVKITITKMRLENGDSRELQ